MLFCRGRLGVRYGVAIPDSGDPKSTIILQPEVDVSRCGARRRTQLDIIQTPVTSLHLRSPPSCCIDDTPRVEISQ